jgi:hypothetical protein
MGLMDIPETTVRNYHCRPRIDLVLVQVSLQVSLLVYPNALARMRLQAVEKCSIIMRLGTMGTSFTSRLLYSSLKRV